MESHYGHKIVDVKCLRDEGFNRFVKVKYAIQDPFGEKKIVYLDAQCDMHCGKETCIRCCNAVLKTLWNGKDIKYGEVLELDFDKLGC